MLLIKRIFLVLGFSIGITGFLIGALSEYKSLGIVIFLIGFFIGSAATITLMFSVPTEIAGRQIGSGNKIVAVGFGITVLSQLFEFLFKLDSLYGDIFFGIGSMIMVSGILLTIVKITR